MRKGRASSPRKEALLLLGGLAFLLLLFFWKNLIGFPFARTFFWEDFIYQNYPYRAFLAEQLRSGTLPLWNPFQFGGMPYVADVQAAAFYPPNALLALFVSSGRLDAVWVELLGILHALAGGFFMGLLVRNRTRCTYAAAVAAIAWTFSGFFVVRMIHLNIISVIAWAPAILLLLILSVEKRSVSAALGGGLLFGLSTLAGAPQYTLYILFILGVYALTACARHSAEGGGKRLAPLLYLLLIVLTGGGVSAIQFLPTTELTDLSMRSEMTYEKSTECSMPPASFPTLLLPRLYGNAAGWNNRGYWGPGKYFFTWELATYTGIVIVLLAGIALIFRPREKLVLLGAAIALFGILLALGKLGPLHPLFYHTLPLYDKFRCPGRAILLTSFALILLAGRGAQLLSSRPPGKGKTGVKPIYFLVGGILVSGAAGYLVAMKRAAGAGITATAPHDALHAFIAFLAVTLPASALLIHWARSRKGLAPILRFALLLLIVLELFYYGFGYNDGKLDPKLFYKGKADPVEVIRTEVGGYDYRVKTRAREGMVLPRNQGTINHLRSVDGYNQLLLERFNTLHTSESIPLLKRLNLLGVKVYALYDAGLKGLTLAKNEGALPRAYFVGSGEKADHNEAAIARIASASFNPLQSALIEGEEIPHVGDASGETEVLRWGPNRIDIAVASDGPGYLVLNETYFPAWKVYVDGEPRPALAANYAFRAVRLEGGEQQVSWRYQSDKLKQGALISLVALLLSAAYLIVAGPRRDDRIGEVLASIWEGKG